jgi:hypothetical protein
MTTILMRDDEQSRVAANEEKRKDNIRLEIR